MINEVSVFKENVIFKKRSDDSPLGMAQYVNVDCRGKDHIALQRVLNSILSVYYDPTRGSRKDRPGFVSFEQKTFRNSPDLGLVPYSATG
jgi:hypothetical protein